MCIPLAVSYCQPAPPWEDHLFLCQLKQKPLQEHLGTPTASLQISTLVFPQVMRWDADMLEIKQKSVCTCVVVWLTMAFPGEEGADCCTVRICCPNATFSGTPTVFWGELGGWEATDTTVSCLAKQRSSLNLCAVCKTLCMYVPLITRGTILTVHQVLPVNKICTLITTHSVQPECAITAYTQVRNFKALPVSSTERPLQKVSTAPVLVWNCTLKP